MSQRSPRRRAPVTGGRRIKPPHDPSPLPRRGPLKTLKRCSSAPLLLARHGDVDGHHVRSGGTSFCPETFSDAFLSSPCLLPFSFSQRGHSNQIQGYEKEAKVVFTVTFEGSPGPVRTMVKLGSSVEETIRRVVDRYREEGRSPKLDPDLTSSFQLHHSHFSLQSLDKSEVIGDVGSRSFYLRKSNGASALNSFHSESAHQLVLTRSSAPCISTPQLLLPSFVARKINKIVRRAHRLWKIVICSQ